jgi:hypothetical protein
MTRAELAGTQAVLGIVPMGTGNLLARNLRIPRAHDRAVGVLVAGGRRRIDLGQLTVGGRHELLAVACGVGFDAEVMNATGLRIGDTIKLTAADSSVSRRRSSPIWNDDSSEPPASRGL